MKFDFRPLIIVSSLALTACTSTTPTQDNSYALPIGQSSEVYFINDVAPKYGISSEEARNAIAQARFQPTIITLISKPAEGKAWGDYRDLLITPKRVQKGKEFMNDHKLAFTEAQKDYGVPPEIISSILGMETFYGKNTGKYRVLDSLSTLSFGYPKRAPFFQQELAKYILLCKQNHWPVTQLKGSYAGAFGWSQFMPSSYLKFATSAYPGAAPDLYNPNDAIVSIANYFKENGWRNGGAIAVRINVAPTTCEKLTCGQRKPLYTVAKWKAAGAKVPANISDDLMASVVTLSMDDGKEHWMVFHNFYVITTYNISINYAMAAFELSKAMKRP